MSEVAGLEYAIEAVGVGMTFNMGREKFSTLKEYCLRLLKGALKFDELVALRDVSFSVRKGDIFGIVGLNGAGKSTLLKIVSGIMKPTCGTVAVRGSISPLIELGAGFNVELTARENIFLNGSVLGHSNSYIKEKFDEIVEFSEMRAFLDMPMKNYSSGMVARVGFAVATVTKPEILIVDEILGVGDYRFQEKCERRIGDLMSGGTTVLVVSHSLGQIEQLCRHAMWLERGEVRMVGGAAEVCRSYSSKGAEGAHGAEGARGI
ncbi:MAG: ABC transporter ATP-binding protein [Clostridiales bacterium]|jgi:ABC-type polysaccharide/polyol phosphate transport system ATPase subunit|nr:ABC transporter ATP-binding protein [Clostridiales bacterium]